MTALDAVPDAILFVLATFAAVALVFGITEHVRQERGRYRRLADQQRREVKDR